jgi:hypothetical protein
MEDKGVHLGFIQAVITRMNANSFTIKGLSIVVLVAVLGVFGQDKNMYYPVAGFGLVVFFWLYDSYYLHMESKFRDLYADVVNGEVTNFSMDTKKYSSQSFFKSFFSLTELGFYLPQLLLLITLFAWAFILLMIQFLCRS